VGVVRDAAASSWDVGLAQVLDLRVLNRDKLFKNLNFGVSAEWRCSLSRRLMGDDLWQGESCPGSRALTFLTVVTMGATITAHARTYPCKFVDALAVYAAERVSVVIAEMRAALLYLYR
jgi:hypothetical protein